MDVTVGDERFDRYYRRIQLGLRLMSHGARVQTASDWSGLTLDQLDTLRKRWLPGVEEGFRGPCPSSFQPFFRSSTKASHAALMLRLPQVCEVTGLCRSMIYQMEADLRFPKRVKLGTRAVGWIEDEVRAWLMRRIEASREQPAHIR